MAQYNYLYKIKNKLKRSVNNGTSWKWIQKEEVETYLQSGWKLGKVKSNTRI